MGKRDIIAICLFSFLDNIKSWLLYYPLELIQVFRPYTIFEAVEI